MIKNIGWTLGNDCSCKCKHCYSFSVRQKGQNLTKEIVDKVIEQIEKLNVETVNFDKYTGGVIVIPSYLSKGLEFDSVIIYSNKYSENILDTKLFYVACTRAMHTLDIISK